jgi:hypothetical protein
LFKYPRSVAAGCLAGLSGTGITGFLLWQVTLFVMVLHVTPAQASGLVIWLSLGQIVGRFFCSWISDAMSQRGRPPPTSSVRRLLAVLCSEVCPGKASQKYLKFSSQPIWASWSVG